MEAGEDERQHLRPTILLAVTRTTPWARSISPESGAQLPSAAGHDLGVGLQSDRGLGGTQAAGRAGKQHRIAQSGLQRLDLSP